MKKQQTLSAFFGKPSSTVKAVEGSQNARAPKISETKPKSPEMHEALVAGTEDNKRTISDEDTPRKSKRSRKSVVVSDDENTETDEPGPSSSEGKVHNEQATKPSKMFDLFTNNSSTATSKSPKKPSTAGKKASTFPDPVDRMDEDPKSEDNHNEDVAVANDTPSSSKAEDDVPDLSIAAWKKGEKVPYEALVKTFEAIDQTTKRLKIADILSSFFRLVIALSPEDLKDSIYLCVNKLAPEYEGVELGIGESLLVKAISTATGRTIQSIKTDYETEGDLGAVAQASRSMQKTMFVPGKLSVRQVYNTLKEIAMISGNSSMQKKVDKIRGLLVACRGNEAKFLIRSLEGKLRIGLAEQTVLAAIAQAFILAQKYPPGQAVSLEKNEKLRASVEAATQTLKQVFSELPNYDVIIPALLENEFDTLHSRCSLTPGIPVKPMLAHPTKSLTEVLDRFENSQFTCEFKYDGERNQIHKLEDGRVVIYSRNLENLTAKYPDLVDRLSKAPKDDVKSFILDCEAVAWDREEKRILPFQVLSTRKRKDVATEDVKVQVCLFAFDLLYLNGRPLIREPLRLRRQLLHDSFIEVEGQFSFARAVDASTVDEIQTFLDDSVKGNCEGLMVKTLDKEATYEPSKRSRNWLKVKKDYLGAMGDSVDLVVIGAFYGKGKRTGVYGGYLLACYDDDNEEYQSICKIGTGFSEAALEQHYQFFKDKTIPQPRSYYKFGDNVTPDVWFDVSQVWEVKAADLSISPVHRAAVGHVDPNKGISLRFPRFIRVREDKTPEIATNASQIAEMFRKQNLNTVKQADDPEDDY